MCLEYVNEGPKVPGSLHWLEREARGWEELGSGQLKIGEQKPDSGARLLSLGAQEAVLFLEVDEKNHRMVWVGGP